MTTYKDKNMESTPRIVSPLHQHFDRNISAQAVRTMGAIVAFNHLHSKDHAIAEYGDVGLARCGFLRWIATDAAFYTLLRASHLGLTVNLVATPTNGSKHIEIVCGEFRILLVHDSDPDAVVPISDYGRNAAKENIAPLFLSQEEWEEQNSHVLPTPYTAILFHSKTNTHSIPAVLEIRFPNGEGGYQSAPINLYERFPELQNAEMVTTLYQDIRARAIAPAEVIEDKSHPAVTQQQQQRGA